MKTSEKLNPTVNRHLPTIEFSKPNAQGEVMVLTVHELLAMDIGPKAKHGNAEYIESNNTIRLYVYPGNQFYEVDLDRCTTAKQALNWILHVSKKKWCTGETLKSFIHCLNDACRLREGKNAFEYFGTSHACTRRF